MSRILSAALASAVVIGAAVPASATDAYTTRIEPRAFYGASVTIEHGVRVYRPLPPERHVIVNPGGQTPLSLGHNDTRIIEHSTSQNYFYDNAYRSPYLGSGAYYYGGLGYPRAHGYRRH